MSSGQDIRVFLVDDHEVVRQGIRNALERSGGFDIVGESGTVADALSGIVEKEPSVAVVDIRLPDGDGVELIREIRSRNPGIRCIVLTSFADEQAFYHAVVAGAAGFVVKDAPTEDIVGAVRRVAAGEELITSEMIDDLRARARDLPPDDQFLSGLTPQERRILGLVTDGLTNGEIADELALAEKTVRNYVSNILSKLGMKNRTQLAAHVASRTAARRARRSERYRES